MRMVACASMVCVCVCACQCMSVYCLVRFEFVGILPNVRQTNGGMESKEDDHRQCEVGDYLPCHPGVVLLVDAVIVGSFHLERVHEPHGQVEYEQEDDEGSSRLLLHIFHGAGASARRFDDEEHL